MSSKRLLIASVVVIAAFLAVLGKPAPEPEPEPNPIAAPKPVAAPDPTPKRPKVTKQTVKVGLKIAFKVGKQVAKHIKEKRLKKKAKQEQQQQQQQQQKQQEIQRTQNLNAIDNSLANPARPKFGTPSGQQTKQNIMINLIFDTESMRKLLPFVNHSSDMLR